MNYLTQLVFQLRDGVSAPLAGMLGNVRQAQSVFGAFGADLPQVGGGFEKLAHAAATAAPPLLAVGAIAGSVTLAIHNAAEMGDLGEEIQNTAQKWGIAAESVQAYRRVAKDMGIDQESLGTAFRFLSRSIYENKGAFDSMGVSLQHADGTAKTTEEVFLDVADAMSRMPDGFEKTALALQVFGRGGNAIIPILNQGREAIRALTDDIRDAGLVIDKDGVQKLDDLHEKLVEFSHRWDGFTLRIKIAFANAVNGVLPAAPDQVQPYELGVLQSLEARIKQDAERAGKKLTEAQAKAEAVNQYSIRQQVSLSALKGVGGGPLSSAFAPQPLTRATVDVFENGTPEEKESEARAAQAQREFSKFWDLDYEKERGDSIRATAAAEKAQKTRDDAVVKIATAQGVSPEGARKVIELLDAAKARDDVAKAFKAAGLSDDQVSGLPEIQQLDAKIAAARVGYTDIAKHSGGPGLARLLDQVDAAEKQYERDIAEAKRKAEELKRKAQERQERIDELVKALHYTPAAAASTIDLVDQQKEQEKQVKLVEGLLQPQIDQAIRDVYSSRALPAHPEVKSLEETRRYYAELGQLVKDAADEEAARARVLEADGKRKGQTEAQIHALIEQLDKSDPTEAMKRLESKRRDRPVDVPGLTEDQVKGLMQILDETEKQERELQKKLEEKKGLDAGVEKWLGWSKEDHAGQKLSPQEQTVFDQTKSSLQSLGVDIPDKQLREWFNRLRDGSREGKSDVDSMSESFVELGTEIGGDLRQKTIEYFAEVLDHGKNAWSELGKFITSTLQSIDQALVNATNKLMQGFMKAIGAAIGFAIGGPAGADIGAFFGEAVGSGLDAGNSGAKTREPSVPDENPPSQSGGAHATTPAQPQPSALAAAEMPTAAAVQQAIAAPAVAPGPEAAVAPVAAAPSGGGEASSSVAPPALAVRSEPVAETAAAPSPSTVEGNADSAPAAADQVRRAPIEQAVTVAVRAALPPAPAPELTPAPAIAPVEPVAAPNALPREPQPPAAEAVVPVVLPTVAPRVERVPAAPAQPGAPPEPRPIRGSNIPEIIPVAPTQTARPTSGEARFPAPQPSPLPAIEALLKPRTPITPTVERPKPAAPVPIPSPQQVAGTAPAPPRKSVVDPGPHGPGTSSEAGDRRRPADVIPFPSIESLRPLLAAAAAVTVALGSVAPSRGPEARAVASYAQSQAPARGPVPQVGTRGPQAAPLGDRELPIRRSSRGDDRRPNVTVNVSAFDTRDAFGRLTSPFGQLRQANAQIFEQGLQ